MPRRKICPRKDILCRAHNLSAIRRNIGILPHFEFSARPFGNLFWHSEASSVFRQICAAQALQPLPLYLFQNLHGVIKALPRNIQTVILQRKCKHGVDAASDGQCDNRNGKRLKTVFFELVPLLRTLRQLTHILRRNRTQVLSFTTRTALRFRWQMAILAKVHILPHQGSPLLFIRCILFRYMPLPYHFFKKDTPIFRACLFIPAIVPSVP